MKLDGVWHAPLATKSLLRQISETNQRNVGDKSDRHRIEISLAIDTPDGIVLVVACSHPTIEKIVEAAKATINKPIHLVIGGTHLRSYRELLAQSDDVNDAAKPATRLAHVR
jgi:metal-dependent hydrolase (beta-lactamase superfamily II)